MVDAQQVTSVPVNPGQLTQVQPGQLGAAPGVSVSQVGDILTSIMPLITVMMLFMMLTPMMRGLGDAFKSR